MNTNTNFVQNFKKDGYFQYPISFEQTKVNNQLMGFWKKFLFQPSKDKLLQPFDDYLGGYEYRGPKSLDYKENFHISLDYELPDNATQITKEFVSFAKEYILDIKNTVIEMVSIMDQAGNSNLSKLILDPVKARWTMRCINYPMQFRKLLAASHIDKGITIHITETSKGLKIFWKGKWHLVKGDKSKMHGYFGMLGQLYSNSAFPALTHKVVSTLTSMFFGRKTIVLFIDFGDYIYDKASWGPTQKVFPNGENYDMSQQEFFKYFKLK